MSIPTDSSCHLYNRCGTFDVDEGRVTIYDANSKFSIHEVVDSDVDNLQPLGVLTAVRDCVATVNENGDTEIDKFVKKIVVENSSPPTLRFREVPRRLHESLNRPSECIEMTMKNVTKNVRCSYTHSVFFEPERLCGPKTNKAIKMAAIGRMCELPVSTVGMKLRIENKGVEDIGAVVYNPSGVAGFNIFNSSPVRFEAHSEQDVLVMMVTFLKYNSLWGGDTANMDLFKFDYSGAFFDRRWMTEEDETSFTTVRAQLLASYYKCKGAVEKATRDDNNHKGYKRKGDHRETNENWAAFSLVRNLEANTNELVNEAIEGSKAVVGGKGCPHPKEATHIYLEGDDKGYCIACFSTLFFIPADVTHHFVSPKDLLGAQRWVDERLRQGLAILGPKKERRFKHLTELLADLTQVAHGWDFKLGSSGRRWNWPTVASSLLHEFILSTLFKALIEIREPLLPVMDIDILYCLLNPFGKMLLIFLHNSLVMTTQRNEHTPSPGGTALGKWWDVNYAGPNLWCFQITKCERETGRGMDEIASLETLGRLPWLETRTVDDRIIFKGYCRGENLTGPGEILSDVTQSVKTMGIVLENRDFLVDREENCITSEPCVGPVLCSLEVTGYRLNRSQGSRNSGRVSARVMRILDTREGARVWYSSIYKALVFERVNHKLDVSLKAMERALYAHKIMYYDIETNCVNFTEKEAVITSICCCLCTGGDISRGGERSVFGLAAPGTDPKLLKERVLGSYSGDSKRDCDGGEYVVTDYAPDIVNIYPSELELLLGFSEYIQSRRPHVVSGWNSSAFDDPFVFTRMVKHLSRPNNDSCVMASRATVNSVLPNNGGRHATPRERMALATSGLFDFSQYMDPSSGYLMSTVSFDLLSGAESQSKTKFHETNKEVSRKVGSSEWFQEMMGCLCVAIRLDLMKVCAKTYKDALNEFNLNAVLAKVSKVADLHKNVKDVVDLHYHLLGFLKLKNLADQATVHVYCCKDAYLAAVVSTSINKEGEIFRLSLDSALIESVVVANLVTPLCIGEGAICRNMGIERASKRGVGIRRHSIATKTKGGMVSQPLINNTPYQTIDMTSLYPMTMTHNNFCVTTFVSQRQVIELRDRMLLRLLRADPKLPLCDALDQCNFEVLGMYRPTDIAVSSWQNVNTNKGPPLTRLEKKLGFRFTEKRADGGDDWCKNVPPNMAVVAGGLDYFPEIACDTEMQLAARVNDDMHIAPSSIEYMLQVLPLLVIDRPHIAAHITAGRYQTQEDCLQALEKDFNEEKDTKIVATHWTFVGLPQTDFKSNPISERIKVLVASTKRNNFEDTDLMCRRLSTLLDRIYRRVTLYDSADDPEVRLWTSRLINVGMSVRTWSIRNTALRGTIPAMQTNYRAQRVIMQENAKKCASEGDKRGADLNKVGQMTMKLSMNSVYGHLAINKDKNHKGLSAKSVTGFNTTVIAGGTGGGTRHAAVANQITETSRCVFGNISCALQQCLPNTKQVYGDTDSVFCVHNIPGDGEMMIRESDGKLVYVLDLQLKYKMSRLIPLLVNSTTKGIRYVQRRDAGDGTMNIAHERLAIQGMLFAKKSYHMLHFNEKSPAYASLLELCEVACRGGEGKGEGGGRGEWTPVPSCVDKFVTLTPCPQKTKNHVVPHNPGLIFKAANEKGGEKLKKFLDLEGISDKKSLAEWFGSSKVWIELDATVVNNLYASKIVDAETGVWIDITTSKVIVDEDSRRAVSQADAVFTSYKKGAYVKKGIPVSTKLKALQTLVTQQFPTSVNRKQWHSENVKHHVDNFSSHTTDPSMMITSARVNKLDPNVVQTRPNPLALSIHNHLNPSSPLSLGQKFSVVTAVSAWYLTADSSEIPPGYFSNSKGVRWNWEMMRGLVSCLSIKSLSVVPNAIMTIYDVVDSDKKTLSTMIKKTTEVLSMASAMSGFSLRRGALSFNTGVIVANDLAMACFRFTDNHFGPVPFARGERQYEEYYDDDYDVDNDDDDDDDDVNGDDDNKKRGHEVGGKGCCIPVVASGEDSPRKVNAQDIILKRLVKSFLSACPNATKKMIADHIMRNGLNQYIVHTMGLDKRVADQLDALVNQLEITKMTSDKKKCPNGSYRSTLDDMVAQVKVEFHHVLTKAAELTKLHWQICPVTAPEDETRKFEGAPFKIALDALSSRYKCTDTCNLASCQSLYFVLLTTLALNFENERRRRKIPFSHAKDVMAELLFGGCQKEAEEAMAQINIARRLEMIRTSFPKIYNIDSDCIIYLFEYSGVLGENSVASMCVDEIRNVIIRLSESKTTGKIWNCGDVRFFGRLIGKEEKDAKIAMCHTEERLPFVTGVYHRVAVEIAAASLATRLMTLRDKNNCRDPT
uniref:DNA-directed DNA polymerase n=1 Tax=Metapenaeus ensis nimavirus TaxID=2133794 RepID=A0A401IPB5_9VIRU|nr:MAG: wsv514-like protein [Metapenaeus ensis nimavirus]GBG35455.1 wsv514-like protein [Metapenaeus ensis nimavirus]